MHEPGPSPTTSSDPQSAAQLGGRLGSLKDRSQLPGSSWKLLSISVLSMLIGIVWWIASPPPSQPAAQPSSADTRSSTSSPLAPASGFVETQRSPGDQTSSRTAQDPQDAPKSAPSSTAPLAFRMGFSFFMGFAVAFALRRVITVAITIIGFAFLLLFGLQYAGVIDVSWDAISGRFDTVQSWLLGQVESVRAFAKGVLPSATAATVGLFAGWRRKRI